MQPVEAGTCPRKVVAPTVPKVGNRAISLAAVEAIWRGPATRIPVDPAISIQGDPEATRRGHAAVHESMAGLDKGATSSPVTADTMADVTQAPPILRLALAGPRTVPAVGTARLQGRSEVILRAGACKL